MYAHLNGTLSEKNPDTVVIECNGIGFELKIPLSTYEVLPELYSTVRLYVYTYHNDDGTRLFGFFKKQEKELFRLLINISGIGPKMALALMSTVSIKDLVTAIVTQNHNIIAKAPGRQKDGGTSDSRAKGQDRGYF